MQGQYPRRGKTVDTDLHGEIIAAVLWGLGLLFVCTVLLWSCSAAW